MPLFDAPPVALVLDDEPLFRWTCPTRLERAGYRVLEAATGQEALCHLDGPEALTLLLTDVRVPGDLDGFGLAREVARRWPGIAIIVISAEVQPKSGDLPAKAKFLAKPFNEAQIKAALIGAARSI